MRRAERGAVTRSNAQPTLFIPDSRVRAETAVLMSQAACIRHFIYMAALAETRISMSILLSADSEKRRLEESGQREQAGRRRGYFGVSEL